MSELSPAAQAVLNKAFSAYDEETLYVSPAEKHAGMVAAAAIRAAADQVVPMALCVHNDDFVYVRHQLHAIADELKVQ